MVILEITRALSGEDPAGLLAAREEMAQEWTEHGLAGETLEAPGVSRGLERPAQVSASPPAG